MKIIFDKAKLYKNLYRYYVKAKNFYVNNFFVHVLCLKQNDKYTYLDGNYYYFRYFLLLIPFYFVKLIANMYNTELIYNIDGIYGITNVKINHIIPYISNCIISDDIASLNISAIIRLYNSSIPLSFFINYNHLYKYHSIKLVYIMKGTRFEKDFNLKEIDSKKYLIYQLFEN